jgi:broad specificity phosphatase PhoE
LIDIATRDVDVPLSELGIEQSRALGRWFGQLPEEAKPTVVLTSTYVRARDSARIAVEAAGMSLDAIDFVMDERLREKEFGVLDRYTKLGIQQKFPELHEQRSRVGKFYFRPPGGESWADVILRLHSVVNTLTRMYVGERVLIVAHQVTVNCFRYLFERMDEQQILAIDHAGDVPNCAVTSYECVSRRGHEELERRLVNFIAPLAEAGAPVTTEPDVQAAPKA